MLVHTLTFLAYTFDTLWPTLLVFILPTTALSLYVFMEVFKSTFKKVLVTLAICTIIAFEYWSNTYLGGVEFNPLHSLL